MYQTLTLKFCLADFLGSLLTRTITASRRNWCTVKFDSFRPAGIEINQCARMSLMLRRAPAAAWLTEEWQQKMHQIENCRHCGHCMSKCPYGLNTPELLQANYKDYWEVLAASKAEK